MQITLLHKICELPKLRNDNDNDKDAETKTNFKLPKYSNHANYLNTQQRNDVEDLHVETGRDIGIFFIDSTNT